jgi:hypothetical protein
VHVAGISRVKGLAYHMLNYFHARKAMVAANQEIHFQYRNK